MDALNLRAPGSWQEASQQQLESLLRAIAVVNRSNFNKPFSSLEDYSAQSAAQVAIYCLMRWNKIRIIAHNNGCWLLAHEDGRFNVSAGDLAAATLMIGWVKSLPEMPVRLDVIDGAQAVDADLDVGFSFDDWLSCETLWQGYQVSNDNEMLRLMAEILYRKKGINLRPHEMLCIFYWWAGVKSLVSRLYPNFFQVAPQGIVLSPDREMMRRSMNAQIRALTKGDITKEDLILSMDCHRALTELDALAKEYDELNRKYPSK